MAQVDFINHTLGQELLNIIKSWNKTLETQDKLYKRFQKYLSFLQPMFDLSIQMLFFIIYIIILENFNNSIRLLLSTVELYIIACVLVGLFVFRTSWNAKEKLCRIVTQRLARLGNLPSVILTAGDKKLFLQQKKKQKNYILRIISEQSLGIITNIIATWMWITFK